VVKQVGVQVGQKFTMALIKKIPGKVIIEINKKIGFRLLTKAGEKGAINLTKGVPIVGGVIGGGFDAVATRAVGEFARRFMAPEGAEAKSSVRRRPMERLKALRSTVGRRSLGAGDVVRPPVSLPSRLDVLIGWTVDEADGAGVELDVSGFICGSGERVRSERDFVFFNNRSSSDGAVRLVDVVDDAGIGVRARFAVDLGDLADDVSSVVFVVSLYQPELNRRSFGDVDDIFLQVHDRAGAAEPLSCDITSDHEGDAAVVIGELRRTAGVWDFRMIGEGYPGGLAGVAEHYGVDV
jgi:tellurium resistance protein TerD